MTAADDAAARLGTVIKNGAVLQDRDRVDVIVVLADRDALAAELTDIRANLETRMAEWRRVMEEQTASAEETAAELARLKADLAALADAALADNTYPRASNTEVVMLAEDVRALLAASPDQAHPPLDREKAARWLCSDDDSMRHHDRTDDYPCTACKAKADALIAECGDSDV